MKRQRYSKRSYLLTFLLLSALSGLFKIYAKPFQANLTGSEGNGQSFNSNHFTFFQNILWVPMEQDPTTPYDITYHLYNIALQSSYEGLSISYLKKDSRYDYRGNANNPNGTYFIPYKGHLISRIPLGGSSDRSGKFQFPIYHQSSTKMIHKVSNIPEAFAYINSLN